METILDVPNYLGMYDVRSYSLTEYLNQSSLEPRADV